LAVVDGLTRVGDLDTTRLAQIHSATLTHRWQIDDGLLASTFAGTLDSSEVARQGQADMVLTPVGN